MGITRQELFSRLQLIRVMEPITEQALETRERLAYRGKLGDDSPHGRLWHTSFHASSFPGDDPLACPRKALYTLMDVPQDAPFSPKSRLMMEMGKTIEDQIVEGFYHEGILLSPPPWEETQLGFTDDECWLTGNCDAVILPPALSRPHLWECKMKYARDIEEMRVGLRGPDEGHIKQTKTYIAYIHELSKHLWSDLPALRDGTIYYVSRDNPRDTAEFFIDYDPKYKEVGREKLKQWKEWFEEDILPSQESGVIPLDVNAKGQEVVSKRHPLGKEFRWTYQPCQWCDFKKTCRADFKSDVVELSESNGVEMAQSMRPKTYTAEKIRKVVFAAWEND